MDLNILSAVVGQIANQPASALIIVALSIIAYLLEIYPNFNSKYIPHVTVLLGMIFYPLFAARSSVPYSYPYPLAVLVVNGLISGFISIIVHVSLIRFLINKFGAQPAPQQTAQPTEAASVAPEVQPSSTDGVPPALSVVFLCCSLLLIAGCVSGCAGGPKYAPGADPLTVQCEALETKVQNGFDIILHADNANRSYFMTNAPGLHGACEWLRSPISYHGTTTLARAQCIVLQLDDVKLDYKAGRSDSNQLATAMSVLASTFNQVQIWLPTMLGTNTIH